MSNSAFPHIQKAVTDFMYDQEGNIPRNKIMSIGSMLLIMAFLLGEEAFAAHGSHSSHSSHKSHASHSSGSTHSSHASSTTTHSNTTPAHSNVATTPVTTPTVTTPSLAEVNNIRAVPDGDALNMSAGINLVSYEGQTAPITTPVSATAAIATSSPSAEATSSATASASTSPAE